MKTKPPLPIHGSDTQDDTDDETVTALDNKPLTVYAFLLEYKNTNSICI